MENIIIRQQVLIMGLVKPIEIKDNMISHFKIIIDH
jgi:hypothetical protein